MRREPPSVSDAVVEMCFHGRIPRRRSLQLIAATLAAAAAGSFARAHAQGRYAGPLVDAHTHFKQSSAPTISDLMALYDQVGISGVFLFGEPWPLATAARDAYPERVVPFLAESYGDALHPDSSYVNPDGLSQLLGARVVAGLGEVILRHSPFQLSALHGFAAAAANHVPADDPRLIRAYQVAGEHGVAVNVHQEAAYVAELERAIAAAPDTTFVWAHAGHGPASILDGLLRRNPNVMADLSARSPWLGPGTVLTQPNGALSPEWRRLLAEFPDRIVFGLDLFVTEHYRAGYVSQMVEYYRGLLGQLEPSVAALIAHQNAERIGRFGLAA